MKAMKAFIIKHRWALIFNVLELLAFILIEKVLLVTKDQIAIELSPQEINLYVDVVKTKIPALIIVISLLGGVPMFYVLKKSIYFINRIPSRIPSKKQSESVVE